jgi:hypothetical protein
VEFDELPQEAEDDSLPDDKPEPDWKLFEKAIEQIEKSSVTQNHKASGRSLPVLSQRLRNFAKDKNEQSQS